MDAHTPFKKRHTLQERIEKSKKQMASNPGKIVIIVEKHPKSVLPTLTNPRYIPPYSASFARRTTSSV